MNTTVTLVLYLLLGGSMQVAKIKQPDLDACQHAAAQAQALANSGQSVIKHAECVSKPSRAKSST